jgi:hypothetical protein
MKEAEYITKMRMELLQLHNKTQQLNKFLQEPNLTVNVNELALMKSQLFAMLAYEMILSHRLFLLGVVDSPGTAL